MQRSLWCLFGLSVFSISFQTVAGCGTASCSLVTQHDAMGFVSEAGWQLGLRYEYIDQDTPRNGTTAISVGHIHQHHDEVYTLNRNLIATLDYRNPQNWGVSISIPYLQREHYHIHNHMGTPHNERWDIASLGDIRAIGHLHGLQVGLKLATGDTRQTNDDGDLAERSLQPGSGTTDFIFGYMTGGTARPWELPIQWFTQIQLQVPLAEHNRYRSGTQYSFDGGIVFRAGSLINPLLQLNALVKERDEGTAAEPANTGGEFLWLSPGLSGEITDGIRLYGFVQLPIYQRVNGVQLTAERALTVGINWQL